jgi:hypothetical protein
VETTKVRQAKLRAGGPLLSLRFADTGYHTKNIKSRKKPNEAIKAQKASESSLVLHLLVPSLTENIITIREITFDQYFSSALARDRERSK